MGREKGKGHKQVSDNVFVECLLGVSAKDGTYEDVAAAISKVTGHDYAVGSVSQRVAKLKKDGINLPQFKRGAGKRERDVNGLNAMIVAFTGLKDESSQS